MSIAGAGAAAAAGIGAAGNAVNFLSNIRSATLPRAGEIAGDLMSVYAVYTDSTINDWRVRMTLPTWPSFRGSPVLKPLKDAGGMIFPYTPTVQINSTANYSAMTPIHSNFKFNTYQHSDPGTITITAPMNVEDSTQALYWIGALHYFRSMTKMFSGNDPKAGNPPPIVQLSGYGSYVLNNIPVVVSAFGTSLTPECDYIPVNTNTSIAGAVNAIAGGIGSIAGSVGSAFGVSKVTDKLTNITDGIETVATMANSMGLGMSMSGGIAHVPTKSTFTITLIPMYSRTSARKFSLDNFVAGGYLNNNFGYI
jgi:hypothetical protein